MNLAAPTAVLPFVIQAILGFPIPPVTIFSGNACEDLTNGSCPTYVGQEITARLYMDIPTTLPAVLSLLLVYKFTKIWTNFCLQISTNVRATVRDGLNQIQVCVQIAVNLV